MCLQVPLQVQEAVLEIKNVDPKFYSPGRKTARGARRGPRGRSAPARTSSSKYLPIGCREGLYLVWPRLSSTEGRQPLMFIVV